MRLLLLLSIAALALAQTGVFHRPNGIPTPVVLIGIAFADAETPTGSDGTYQVAHAPDPAASLILTRNGIVLRRTADYTLTSSVIVFAAAVNGIGGPPESTDLLQAWYRYREVQ